MITERDIPYTDTKDRPGTIGKPGAAYRGEYLRRNTILTRIKAWARPSG